ncbi:MAG: hypothetical protein ACUVRY_10470 [Thermoanaerobaculaceae bacterium]
MKISSASVQLVPIRDTSPAESFDVLITGVRAQEFASVVQFTGIRHFFRARFTATGMGSLAALPFEDGEMLKSIHRRGVPYRKLRKTHRSPHARWKERLPSNCRTAGGTGSPRGKERKR